MGNRLDSLFSLLACKAATVLRSSEGTAELSLGRETFFERESASGNDNRNSGLKSVKHFV